MKFKVTHILVLPCFLALLLTACAQELALSEPEYGQLCLKLSYDATKNHDDTMKNTGKIRYIIRSFPAGVIYNKVNPVQEFTIIKDLKEGYDHEVTLDFQTGDYDVMVWSDLIQEGSETSCHIADDFGGIYLRDGYAGNNMYRDAFRGMATVSVPAEDGSKAELEIEMSRPLARFHLVSNDFVDFVDSNKADADGELSLDDYHAVIYYVGFMPNAYSLYTDKTTDSTTGVMFASALQEISDEEVYMGFDYVFIGNSNSYVSVKVGVYDISGNLVSMTNTIKIPLFRDEETVVSGKFMTQKSSDGIQVDPEYDGNHTIVIP